MGREENFTGAHPSGKNWPRQFGGWIRRMKVELEKQARARPCVSLEPVHCRDLAPLRRGRSEIERLCHYTCPPVSPPTQTSGQSLLARATQTVPGSDLVGSQQSANIG